MKVLDISFAQPPLQWWKDRYTEGYRAMFQDLWTGGFAGNDGLKAVAVINLKNARTAGFECCAYANASPPDWWSLSKQMENIKINAGSEWSKLQVVAVDVEIPGITLARITELANALKAEGKNNSGLILGRYFKSREILYTARWFWTGHMANSKDKSWLRYWLWSAHYDSSPDIDFGSASYGPWTISNLLLEQYAGTVKVGGYDIDLNSFVDSLGSSPILVPPAVVSVPIPAKEIDMIRFNISDGADPLKQYTVIGDYKVHILDTTILKEMGLGSVPLKSVTKDHPLAKLPDLGLVISDLQKRVGYEAHLGVILKFVGVLTALGSSDPLPILSDLKLAIGTFEQALKTGKIEQ